MPAGERRSIATRTGDDGTTSLLYGQRVPKDHPQIEAVGAVDELNAALGVAKSAGTDASQKADLASIQAKLIALMGEVSCAESDSGRFATSRFTRLTDDDLTHLDGLVAAVEERGPKFDGWASPGANPRAAALDVARTVARRAERQLVGLSRHGRDLRPLLPRYLNRLSDLLWLLAREAEN